MEDLIEFYLPKDNCMEISKFVYQEKDSWVKGLNNVKSKTSGFDANYKFLHNIGDHCCNNILPKVTDHETWNRVSGWVNFYEKGDHTLKHHHLPEHYSMIGIIKPSKKNCLYFKINDKNFEVDDEEGLCLIFNSKVEHWVEPVDSDRITISMDFKYNA
tara:strand:+ start:1574 stop:2047 length:474 start_codon:yes stop_codon:yes gene_type:complete